MGPALVNLVIINEVIVVIMSIVKVFLRKLSIARDRGSLFK